MTLRDHFTPPLSVTRPSEGFHSTWATMIAQQLNQTLPPRFVAIPLTSRGPMVEIALARDLFEVRIIEQSKTPRLVGAIELISPANKDRPATRQSFAGKCAGYLRLGIGLIVVDVVTSRNHDLHRQLLELLELEETPAGEVDPLYAVAYRTQQEEQTRLSIWPRRLRVGSELPTLPLWLSAEVVVPVDLATSYRAACEMLRME